MPLVITDLDHNEDDFGLDTDLMSCLWDMESRHFWHAARKSSRLQLTS